MSNWQDVAAQADLFEDAGIAVTVNGQELALFSVAGQVYAIDNACTHGPARLCEGWVQGQRSNAPCTKGALAWKLARRPLAPLAIRCGFGPCASSKAGSGSLWTDWSLY